jgi:hypothetical protein
MRHPSRLGACFALCLVGACADGRFDIRAFHDRVLENGTVPLALLRTIVEQWITEQRR